jgi:hypothetical protein
MTCNSYFPFPDVHEARQIAIANCLCPQELLVSFAAIYIGKLITVALARQSRLCFGCQWLASA